MDSLLLNIHPLLLSLSFLLIYYAYSRDKIAPAYLGAMILGIEVLRNVHFAAGEGLLHSSMDLIGIGLILSVTMVISRRSDSKLVWILGVLSLWGIHEVLTKTINDRVESGDVSVELLVQFGSHTAAKNWIDNHISGLKIQVTYPLFDVEDNSFLLDEYAGIQVDEAEDISALLTKLDAFEEIEHVEYNDAIEFKMPESQPIPDLTLKRKVNDPYLNRQWISKEYDLNKMHRLAERKSGVQLKKKQTVIAILDTGIDAKHEDLSDNYLSIDKKSDADPKGHGTHCAGIAAAVSGNRIGVASLLPPNSPIKVTSVKVLSAFGGGTQKGIIDGIIKAADNGCDVISMSLGGRTSDSKEKAYEEAVKYANSKGAIVVVAAGNSNRDARDYSPANTKGVITVAAVDTLMKQANFSNDISNIVMGISAPGTGIYSTFPNDEYKSFSGTSMATPFVAGLIGIMKSYDSKLTTKQAYDIISKTAMQKGQSQIVNPVAAMESFLR